MTASENIDKLAKALGDFQAEMPKLSRSREVRVKTKSGGSYGFKYTPLEQILEEVLPRLAEYGLSISQMPADNASVTNVLMHESGQWISETASFDISTNNPQDLGGVITYLRRYSLAGILGIVTDEDDDANQASGNKVVSQKDKKQNTRNKKTSQSTSKPKEKLSDDEVTDKINDIDSMPKVVKFFNTELAKRDGKEKDKFEEKYRPVVNDRLEKIKKDS